MTRILKKATAGTLESSDVYVALEPCAQGVELEIESAVYRQFGEALRRTAEEVLRAFGVEGAKVYINDRGALDCVLRARLETAIRRGGEA